MNREATLSPAEAARRARAEAPVTTVNEARALAARLTETMGALIQLMERETELVRQGLVAQSQEVAEEKAELTRMYFEAANLLKANHAFFKASAPDLLAALRKHHDLFRSMLEVNLTVLATAHAVTEGIIRGVSDEMNKRNRPQVYTAAGRQAAAPYRSAAPLTVSRSL